MVLILQFFDHVGMPLCNVPTVAKVLIPKSIIPTELSVIVKVDIKIFTTKQGKISPQEELKV